MGVLLGFRGVHVILVAAFVATAKTQKKTAAGVTGIKCASTTETVNHTTATLVVAIPTAESQLERKSEEEINKGQQGTWNYGRFDRDFNRGE